MTPGRPARDGKDCGIAAEGSRWRPQLFCDYVEVAETEHKAEAVTGLIRKHLGVYAYQEISQAVLSYDTGKGDAILGTMLEARRLPDSRQDHGTSEPSTGRDRSLR